MGDPTDLNKELAVARLVISLLGSLQVQVDGRAVAGVEASKPGALLAYLAVEQGPAAGQAVERRTLAGLLWPDRPVQEALGGLRFALANLRKALGEGRAAVSQQAAQSQPAATQQLAATQFLLADRWRVGLNPQAQVWVDVAAFQQQVAAAEAQVKAGQTPPLEALQAARALYRGRFLQGQLVNDNLAFESWALERRAQLERQHQRLLHLLAAACQPLGQFGEAEEAYRAILARQPEDEAAQRGLMRLLDRTGQRAAALAQFEACRQALKAGLGVEPESETVRLYQAIKGRPAAPVDQAAPMNQAAPQDSAALPDLPADAAAGLARNAAAEPARNAAAAYTPGLRLAGTPFVARQRELTGLEAALEGALAGQGHIVWVTGEAGSGKTALLSEFARRSLARRPDLLVVGGRCNAYSGLGQPYLPFIESVQMLAGEWDTLPWAAALDQEHQARLQAALPWLAQALVELAPALLDRFIGRAALVQRVAQAPGAKAAWLAALRQGSRDLGRREPPRPETGRPETGRPETGRPAALEAGALFEQVTRLLTRLARHSPLVLLLDDLQWVDSGSAALLFHLARRFAASQVLIAAAYRAGELAARTEAGEHPLWGVAAELRRLPGSLQIDLDQADERAFVTAFVEKDPFLQPNRLEEGFFSALARHTGGNPLFTAELLRNLQLNGDLRRETDGAWVSSPSLNWQRLPERIEAAIAGRIARLPEHWLDWLSTASVEGDSFTAEVLARVHGLDEPALLRDLSGPLNVVRGAYRLLQFDGVQWLGRQRLSRYRFRHVLFQTYLYEQMDPAERSRRHAAVGQALEALYAQPAEQPDRYAAEIARHFEAAGLAEPAAAYWLQAGRHALYLSAAVAAMVDYRRGLALLARRTAEPGARPAAPAQEHLEIQLNMGLAAALLSHSDWSGAARGEALQRALDLLQQSRAEHRLPELAPLLYAQANWLIGQNEVERAVQLGDQMLALAGDQPGLPLALACWTAGTSRLFTPDFPGARHYLERALAAYEAAGQPPTLPLIGSDLGVMGRAWLGMVLATSGCLDQAWAMIGQARRRLEPLGKDLTQGGALTLACQVAIARGDRDSLLALAPELLRLGQQHEMPLFQAYGWVIQGEAALLGAASGSPQAHAGLALIRQGMQMFQAGSMRAAQYSWFVRLAGACLRAGQIEAGLEAVAAGLARLPESGPRRSAAAELYRLRGELLLALPHPEHGQAEACFQQALEASRQCGALLWELRAAVCLARLWQSERPAEAQRLLAAVYGRFTEGWACPDLQAARALLDGLDQ